VLPVARTAEVNADERVVAARLSRDCWRDVIIVDDLFAASLSFILLTTVSCNVAADAPVCNSVRSEVID